MSENRYSSDESTAYNMLSNIVNENIDCISFAADMLCIGFGTKIPVCYDKKFVNKSKFYLHIQCDWGLYKNGEQISSYDKLFLSQTDSMETRLSKLQELLKNRFVNRVNQIECEIVEIEFADAMKLQLICKKSISGEQWRFINYVEKYHYVVENENGCFTSYII